MKFRSLALILVGLLTIVSYQNCSVSTQDSGGNPQIQNQSNSIKYFQSTNKVVVHVYYEPGAEPYTGTTGQGYPYWNVLEENLQSIFQFRSSQPVLVVPKDISGMKALPAQNRNDWTGIDLVNLDQQHGEKGFAESESHFHVYFLKGYYNNGSTQKGVIGVSIGGTNVIGMFKQVVQSTGYNPAGPVPKFVEQSTLVHEMGHALGFVNNGVPMASPHQDSEHGAHTLNKDCVMYWQNEGASDLALFIQKFIASSSRVMWGPEVLADAQGISR